MATYFGNQTGGNEDHSSNQETDWLTSGFTCPGSGNQTIKELSLHCYGDGSATVRIAVYNSAGTSLIAQGSSSFSPSGVSFSWQGHLTQGSITPNPATLTGGATYLLVDSNSYNVGGTGFHFDFSTPGGNVMSYIVTDYSGGFPGSIAASGYQNESFCIRCGVDPASGGSANFLKEQYWWDQSQSCGGRSCY